MSDKEIVPYRPGLEGVTAGVSAISDVIAAENRLIYRGYDIRDLAQHCEFEEVAYLVLMGALPTRAQLEAFKAELVADRELPAEVYAVLRALPHRGNLMAALQAGVAALGMLDPHCRRPLARGEPQKSHPPYRQHGDSGRQRLPNPSGTGAC
jgi:citrate synthase